MRSSVSEIAATLLHRYYIDRVSDLFYFYEMSRGERWRRSAALWNAQNAAVRSETGERALGALRKFRHADEHWRKYVPKNFIQHRRGNGRTRDRRFRTQLNSRLTFSDIVQHDGHHDSFLKQTDKRFMKKKSRHWFQVEEKSPFSEARILSYFESHFKQDEKKCCQCYFIPSCASAFGDKISVHNSAMNLLMRHDVTMLLKIFNFHFREIEIIKKL